MKDETFVCEECGGTFPTEWSDEVANDEALKLWGVNNASDCEYMARVCDGCFEKLTGKKSKLVPQ